MTRPTVTGFDAFGGNTPFLGGRRIATQHGESYADWLTSVHGGTGGTDYCGYFFLQTERLLAERGAIGLIATNAISDGDNRRTVLSRLVNEGKMEFFRAQNGMPWPGNAAVLIAVVHMARVHAANAITRRTLNGRPVKAINTRLRAGQEHPEPHKLPENQGFGLAGCFLRGDGFILSPEEAARFVAENPAEREVIKPFLVGDDLNNRADQQPSRFVVTFWDATLEEAQSFPAAFAHIEKHVWPQRKKLKTTGADADHRKHFWRFANTRKELRQRTNGLPRVIAAARVAKNLMFSFTSPSFVPSEQVSIFPLPSWTALAVLQSRIHAAWSDLHSTHMGEAIRYSVSECFGTFPFPQRDPSTIVPAIERIGKLVDEARAAFLTEQNTGITAVYNRLKDPAENDPSIRGLRELHEAMDRAVLEAYGWSDLEVPPFCPRTRSERVAVEEFLDAIVDRLFILNLARADTPASDKARNPGVRKVVEPKKARRQSASRDKR